MFDVEVTFTNGEIEEFIEVDCSLDNPNVYTLISDNSVIYIPMSNVLKIECSNHSITENNEMFLNHNFEY